MLDGFNDRTYKAWEEMMCNCKNQTASGMQNSGGIIFEERFTLSGFETCNIFDGSLAMIGIVPLHDSMLGKNAPNLESNWESIN